MKIHLVKVEDHEGSGECRRCGRTGLRWIATLSDGQQVGLECSKITLGFRPARADYIWAADYRPVAEHVDPGNPPATYILWQHRTGTATRETMNGVLMQVGGVRQTWARRGWAV